MRDHLVPAVVLCRVNRVAARIALQENAPAVVSLKLNTLDLCATLTFWGRLFTRFDS